MISGNTSVNIAGSKNLQQAENAWHISRPLQNSYSVIVLNYICRRTDSPTYILTQPGLKTLSTRAKHAGLKFLLQLLKNNYKIDSSKYLSCSQARQTRNKHARALTEYSCKNGTYKCSLFPLAITEWNQLDAAITSTESLWEFAAQIEKTVRA